VWPFSAIMLWRRNTLRTSVSAESDCKLDGLDLLCAGEINLWCHQQPHRFLERGLRLQGLPARTPALLQPDAYSA
jgi:hypothetical protein